MVNSCKILATTAELTDADGFQEATKGFKDTRLSGESHEVVLRTTGTLLLD